MLVSVPRIPYKSGVASLKAKLRLFGAKCDAETDGPEHRRFCTTDESNFTNSLLQLSIRTKLNHQCYMAAASNASATCGKQKLYNKAVQ